MAGVLTTIKDANGKEISVDISKICDINGDANPESPASATDSQKNRVAKVHDIEYVDANGKAIDNMQLIADMQAGKANVTALDLSIEATHSGPNHNYCVYYEDSMEKDAESFVNPFKKPILKNHNDYSGEPMGRIQQAYHGPSELTDERSAIHLKVRVTDQEAIPKFLDGRYSTVSIGGTMGTVTCNICGKTILKDGKFKFCGHWRGETYKDQICYWGAKDITYHEVSTVNNPADDFAQIMKVTVVTDKDKKEGSDGMDGQGKDNNNNTATAEGVKKSINDMIDQLLGKKPEDSTTPPADNKDATGTGTGADTATDNTTVADGEQKDAQVSDSVKEIEDLKKQLADANTAKENAEKELKDAKAELAKVQEDLKTAQDEAKNMTDMCMTLAAANKEMVADGIIAKEKAAGKLKDDGVEARKKELVGMSMKDLNKVAEETPTATDQRKPGEVTNPGLADRTGDNKGDNKDSNGKADTDKRTTDNNGKKRSVNDVANDIVGKLFK